MSKANRKAKYELYKQNKKNHLLSPALKAEFEPDSVTPEMKAEEEAKAKEIAEKKIQEDQLKEVETPGV